MLGMRIRLGNTLSFGASCGSIEALRGDYDLGGCNCPFAMEWAVTIG